MTAAIAGQLSLYDALGTAPPEPVVRASGPAGERGVRSGRGGPSGPSEGGAVAGPGVAAGSGVVGDGPRVVRPELDLDHGPDERPLDVGLPSGSAGEQPPAVGLPSGSAPASDSPPPAVGLPPPAVGSPPAVDLPPLAVEVTRSKRRKKTAEARLEGSTLAVKIPASCSDDEERYFVDHFRSKFERSRAASVVDLDQRAQVLAHRFGLPTPTSIRWVSNQKHQWGSCTPADGTIRLSDRMATFPRWVVDYVIVHELAHLVEADHSPAFWALVNAYPKTERARGYLIAKDGI